MGDQSTFCFDLLGIEKQCTFEQTYGLPEGVGRSGLRHYSARPENVVERVGIFGRPGGLHGDQLSVEGSCDPARDLVLQSEQVDRVAVEPLRPQMDVAFGVDQLRIDADLVARPPDLPSST